MLTNTFWNFLGQTLPLFVALVAVPRLIKVLGSEKFGILTLAWVVTGYFSIFDFGIGRALTKVVAELRSEGRSVDLVKVVCTGVVLLTLLGFAAGVLAFLFSPRLVNILRLSPELVTEAQSAFRILALSIPAVISAAGCRAVLEGLQQFRGISVLRILLGTLTFAAPVLLLPFSTNIAYAMASLVIVRFAIWGMHLWLCFKAIPEVKKLQFAEPAVVLHLIGFGTWVTVANVVGPLMNYIDRFLVGRFVSLAAVAYYATPVDMMTRLFAISSSVTATFFPAFAESRNDLDRLHRLLIRAVKFIHLTLFPLVLLLMLTAKELLEAWVGHEYSMRGFRVMQVVALGVLINSLAQIPFALLQAVGRASTAGSILLLETPFGIALVVLLTKKYGINGAALAWLIRVLIEAIVLFAAVGRSVSNAKGVQKAVIAGLVLTLGMMAPVLLAIPLTTRLFYWTCAIAVYFLTLWNRGLNDNERTWLKENVHSWVMALAHLKNRLVTQRTP